MKKLFQKLLLLSVILFGSLSVCAVPCAVCHQELMPPQTVCTLSCSHMFHSDCIHDQLIGRWECPQCHVQPELGLGEKVALLHARARRHCPRIIKHTEDLASMGAHYAIGALVLSHIPYVRVLAPTSSFSTALVLHLSTAVATEVGYQYGGTKWETGIFWGIIGLKLAYPLVHS